MRLRVSMVKFKYDRDLLTDSATKHILIDSLNRSSNFLTIKPEFLLVTGASCLYKSIIQCKDGFSMKYSIDIEQKNMIINYWQQAPDK